MIEVAFWDASAVLPLCVEQQASPLVDELFQRYSMMIWWATPVEIHSALARLARTGELLTARLDTSMNLLADLRSRWQEIEPSPSLRDFAEELPARYNLQAADALQLAAASTWTMHRPANRPFISGDQRLLQAARSMGFHTIEI